MNRSNKKQCGAWVDENIASGVSDWLNKNPEKTRTDFLIESVVEGLQELNAIIPEQPPETKKRKTTTPNRRGSKLLLTAWMNKRLVAAVDMYLKQHPSVNRSEFLINFILAKLEKSGVSIPATAGLDPALWRFGQGVHGGVLSTISKAELRSAFDKSLKTEKARLDSDLVKCTKVMEQLVSKNHRKTGKRRGKLTKSIEQLEDEKSKLEGILRDYNAVLRSAKLLAERCKAFGMEVPELDCELS